MKRLTVLLIVAALLGISGHAIAAGRYCGKEARYGWTKTTYFVGPAYNSPGKRLMQVSYLRPGKSPTYYTCSPR